MAVGTRYSPVPFATLATYRVEDKVKLAQYNRIIRQDPWLENAIRSVPEPTLIHQPSVEERERRFRDRIREKIQYIAFRPTEEFQLYLVNCPQERTGAIRSFLDTDWESIRYFIFYHEEAEACGHRVLLPYMWRDARPCVYEQMTAMVISRARFAPRVIFDALVCHFCRGGVYTGVAQEHFNVWRIGESFDPRNL